MCYDKNEVVKKYLIIKSMGTHHRPERTKKEDITEGEKEITSELAEEEKRELYEFGPSDPNEALIRYRHLTADEVREVLDQKNNDREEEKEEIYAYAIISIEQRFSSYDSFEKLKREDRMIKKIPEDSDAYQELITRWKNFELQSAANYAEGIKKVKEMLPTLSRKLMGAISTFGDKFGYTTTLIDRGNNGINLDKVYEALARGKTPLSARELVAVGRKGTVGGQLRYILNGKVIADSHWGGQWGLGEGEIPYDYNHIFGKRVMWKDYDRFIQEVSKLLKDRFSGKQGISGHEKRKIAQRQREYNVRQEKSA